MERFEDNQLIAALESLRPAPSPAFAAELDERAAAGFPRRPRSASRLGRVRTWLGSIRPRQALIPAGAVALLAVVVTSALVATQEETRTNSSVLAPLSAAERPEPVDPGHGDAVGQSAEPRSGGGGGSGQHGVGVQFEAVVPTTTGAPSASGASAAAESSRPGSGPYAAKTNDRDIERSAQMVLGADPTDVGKDAAEVFDAVHAVDGIVLNSSVRGGAEGDAGARFELLIPSAKLGDALASFSAIDTVVSRHETTDDITAPTVRGGELLRDSRAKIDGLLVQLAEASTEAERVSVETELRAERRHNAQLRSRLSTLERRANLSRVSLRIETGIAADSDDSGAWGIGDALDDAGRILGIAAGVTVIALAVLAPFALLALLAWLGNRARLRRARERALA